MWCPRTLCIVAQLSEMDAKHIVAYEASFVEDNKTEFCSFTRACSCQYGTK